MSKNTHKNVDKYSITQARVVLGQSRYRSTKFDRVIATASEYTESLSSHVTRSHVARTHHAALARYRLEEGSDLAVEQETNIYVVVFVSLSLNHRPSYERR